MTETQRNTLRIPSREEFHRYTSNLLCNSDFNTDYFSDPYFQTNRVASALNWTKKNTNSRTYKYKSQH